MHKYLYYFKLYSSPDNKYINKTLLPKSIVDKTDFVVDNDQCPSTHHIMKCINCIRIFPMFIEKKLSIKCNICVLSEDPNIYKNNQRCFTCGKIYKDDDAPNVIITDSICRICKD